MALFELCSIPVIAMPVDQRASDYCHRLSVCWLLQVVTDIKFATYVTNGNYLIYFWAGVKFSRINANNLISVFYDFPNREVIKNGYFTVRLTVIDLFFIEIWFFDTQNTFYLIVMGLKNAFLMPLIPLLYHYLTVLRESSSSSKEELGILVVGWKWLFWCKIHFKTHRILV